MTTLVTAFAYGTRLRLFDRTSHCAPPALQGADISPRFK
jgi:hypothetical protein